MSVSSGEPSKKSDSTGSEDGIIPLHSNYLGQQKVATVKKASSISPSLSLPVPISAPISYMSQKRTSTSDSDLQAETASESQKSGIAYSVSGNSNSNSSNRMSFHPVVIPNLSFLSIPKSTTWMETATCTWCDDDEVLRALPYFGEGDGVLISLSLTITFKIFVAYIFKNFKSLSPQNFTNMFALQI